MYKIEYHKIIDISPLISENLAVFPGDQAFSRKVVMDTDQGDHIGLSSINTSVHIGAHADAPNHYEKSSSGIDQRDLNRYMGAAVVIDVSKCSTDYIQLNDLPEKSELPAKVIFKTQSFLDPNTWNSDFKGISPQVIEHLANNKVTTVGIDTPSIDVASSKDLPSHHMVAKYDMSILEGLILNDVSPGSYYLVALPLKIKDADASPVRAVLLK